MTTTSEKDRVLAVLEAAENDLRAVPYMDGRADAIREVRAAVAEVYAQRDALAALLKRAVEGEGPFGSNRRPEWFNDACAVLAANAFLARLGARP